MTLYTLLNSVFPGVLVSPVHAALVPLQSLPGCPPTNLQCLCAGHGDEPFWRWFQGTTSALLHWETAYIVEAYRLWLVRTLPQIGQWALIPPGSLYQRSILKEMWRVQTYQQASYWLLMLLQHPVLWLLGLLRSMVCHASSLYVQCSK